MSRAFARAAAVAVVALLAVPLLAGPAGATDPPPTPGMRAGAAVWWGGALSVVYRRTDGRVVFSLLTDIPYPPDDLGGKLSGPPAIVTGQLGRYVAGVGTNGAVYYRIDPSGDGIPWQPWTSLGGATGSAPALGCSPGDDLLVWVRGGDGALWRRGAATPWQRVGGTITSAPAAAGSLSGLCPTEQHVVALGTDKAVWEHRAGGWHRVGGASAYAPAIVRGVNRSHVLVVGTNGALYVATRQNDASPWSAFRKLGGTFTSAPAATLWPSAPSGGPLTVVALGGNGQLYRASEAEDAPGPWTFVPFG